MSSKSDGVDARMDNLLLDMKALVLLHHSQEKLRDILRKEISESKDEDIRTFLSLLDIRSRRSGAKGYIMMAVGELVLASFLVFAGVGAFVPAAAGATSAAQLAAYLSQAMSLAVGSNLLSPAMRLVDFGFSIALLLAAFYALHHASRSLRDAGMHSEG